MFIGFVIFMLKLYLYIIMGRQLDRLMPFWQPANILHSFLIFMLLWQINIVVVDGCNNNRMVQLFHSTNSLCFTVLYKTSLLRLS